MSTYSQSGVARGASIVIASLITGYALYWLRGILTPLALALFLMVMIDGVARFLARRAPFLPEPLVLPVALLLSGSAVAATVYVVAGNGAAFAGQLVGAAPRFNVLIAQIAGLFGLAVPPTIQDLVNQLNPSAYLGTVAASLQSFAGGAMYVMIYLGFLIASRAGFAKKAKSLYPDTAELEQAAAIFERIRDGIERYLWIQTITGALIAFLSWAVMAAVGLDNALFWAFVIFVVCFIPVIGGIIAGFLPPLFALVEFTTWWQAGVLFAGLQIILFVVGNVVLPRMQRDSLNIDPVVVLLSLALWGAIWGIPGMFLSTPLTVMAIIILAQFDGSRWIAVLLSGDGEPEGAAGTAPPRSPAAT